MFAKHKQLTTVSFQFHSRVNLSGSAVNSFRVFNLSMLADTGWFDPTLFIHQCAI